ncbi:hypothetical protein WA1_47485 [Scytonema hofmannii PCC 7110]|uniref:Uncharacterized protein n=1 Tax=Scytonema hofmannii PCC 7110 TaxID=128403 RepID=A0A139WXV9_9CYAN|nr:DUF6519 domain-containing protein [Scytonema hofmannii]KYC37266.1 hypothetical protein WA1_47485 [Scytonema hofmannii PCC 7110]
MQGEFRGDFTRNTFNPHKQFLRVLMQQGRVQLDADWNEQVAIFLHYLQTLAADLIGPHGGPVEKMGFLTIAADPLKFDFIISSGHYYVNGLLCASEAVDVPILEIMNGRQVKIATQSDKNIFLKKGQYIYLIQDNPNQDNRNQDDLRIIVQITEVIKELDRWLLTFSPVFPIDDDELQKVSKIRQIITYQTQFNYPVEDREKLKRGNYLVYLDAWERHISCVEDESDVIPSIREVALGGSDTATRSRLVWQVKVKEINQNLDELGEYASTVKNNYSSFLQELGEVVEHSGTGTGKLIAKAQELNSDSGEPCIIAPKAHYRGAENQLYRVEIHKSSKDGQATFKWSRENSSVIFPIIAPVTVGTASTVTVTLAHLGRDSRFSLSEGNWVEIVDDDYILQNRAEPLFKVTSIDRVNFTVTLTRTEIPNSTVGGYLEKHPYLRRWDQKFSTNNQNDFTHGTQIVEENKWIVLEDRVQIQFPALEKQQPPTYRTGDYWLIPARTATGDVEWAGSVNNPKALSPHGIAHHYAPLAVISVDGEGQITSGYYDCRRQLTELWRIKSDNE